MKNNILLICVLSALIFTGCQSKKGALSISSPNLKNRIEFNLLKNGAISYLVTHDDIQIIDTSLISFEFQGEEPFKGDFEVVNSVNSSYS